MEHNLNKKSSALALVPFLIFVVIYLGAGLILQAQGVEMAFYQFPSVTAMFIALLVAFAITKGSLDERFAIFARGAANIDVLTMLMIYLLAGAFSSVAASFVDSRAVPHRRRVHHLRLHGHRHGYLHGHHRRHRPHRRGRGG